MERIWRKTGCAAQAENPHAIVEKHQGALRLSATNPFARDLGLHAGLTLADARARLPNLIISDADPGADTLWLENIADWCDRFTPLVAVDGDDGILLDVTGATHLFGGEQRLLASIRQSLARQQIHVRLSLAATPSMTMAMARFGTEGVLVPEQESETLGSLPVQALRLSEDVTRLLVRLGLKTISMLEGKPRTPLANRFSPLLLDRLDAVLGRIEEPFTSRRQLPLCMAERAFAEPIASEEMMLTCLRRLSCDVASVMEQRGEGGRCFEASVFRADGQIRRLAVETGRPVRDAAVVERLFREKLSSLADPLDPGFGFDLIRLAVTRTEQWERPPERLDGDDAAEAALDQLTDQLSNRLGGRYVSRLLPRDTHWPERAQEKLPAQQCTAPDDPWPITGIAGEPPARPLRLFEPPEVIEALAEVPDGPPARFRWRRVLHDVVKAEGPERIAHEWWRQAVKPLTRDYFRVEDSQGQRFWLLREGLYGLEAQEPRWFVHGVFG